MNFKQCDSTLTSHTNYRRWTKKGNECTHSNGTVRAKTLTILQISQISATKGDFGFPGLGLPPSLETSHAAATFYTHPPIPCSPLRETLYPKRWEGPVLAFGEIASGPYCTDVEVTGQEPRLRKYSIVIVSDCYTKFWINVADGIFSHLHFLSQ